MPIPSIEELFERRAAPAPLTPGELHLWLVRPPESLDAGLLRRLAGILSKAEQDRMAAFGSPADAARHGVGRALARLALSSRAAVDPAEWQFTPSGRPEIASPASALRFNLSHTRDLVACVVSSQDAGVDVESLTRGLPAGPLIRRVCDDRECDDIEGAAPADRTRAFYERWTLKEAYVKARGLGLAVGLKALGFSLSGPPGSRQVQLRVTDQADASEWQFHSIAPTADHVLGLAIRTGGERVGIRYFPET